MKEIGVGIAGYGFIGKVHAYAYRNLPWFYDPAPARVRLVGVCTSRQETADAARAQARFEFATTDFGDLLRRDDIQVINLCTPNHLHKDELLAAMAAGKHIYCDKPVTGNWAEAQAVAAALPAYRGIHQMTLNYRFTNVAIRARQLIQDGFLGPITQFRVAYLHSGSVDPNKRMAWKQMASAGGGVINDLGSHALDLVDWLIGPIAEVLAETRMLYPQRPDPSGRLVAVEAEDAMTVLARLANGGSGVVEASKIATGADDELRIEIHGARGALRLNTMEPNHLEAYDASDPEMPFGGTRGWKSIATVDRFPKPGGWPGPKFTVGWLRSHVHCLYHFVSAVAEGRPASPSLRDGVRLQRLLDIVQCSARERAWRVVPREEIA